MSLGHGPSVIRTGLIFQVDFANVKSYPGTGTNVRNLTGTGDFTFAGSATIPSATNGITSFDGLNPGLYIYEGSGLASHGTSSFTYQFLVRPKTSTSFDDPNSARVFEHSGFPVTYNLLQIVHNSGNRYFQFVGRDTTQTVSFSVTSPSNSVILNQWYLITCIVDRATSKSILYINTTPYETGFSASLGTVGNSAQLRIPSSYAEMQMDLSCAQSYSRALSDAEVKQNFEALRGRVGI
jgi:hypothetical protein